MELCTHECMIYFNNLWTKQCCISVSCLVMSTNQLQKSHRSPIVKLCTFNIVKFRFIVLFYQFVVCSISDSVPDFAFCIHLERECTTYNDDHCCQQCESIHHFSQLSVYNKVSRNLLLFNTAANIRMFSILFMDLYSY